MAGIHGLGVLAILCSLDGIAMGLTLLGVVFSAAWCVSNEMLWLAGAVSSFEIMSDGTGSWTNCRGESHSVSHIKVSWCSQSVLVIGFWQRGAHWRWLILAPDSAAPDALRGLRVWARWRPD